MRYRGLIITGACCAFLMLTGSRSQAQFAVVCANCASEWTQLANYAQLAMQYKAQADTLLNTIQQVQMMGREATNLATHPLTSITADLAQLSSILTGTQGLAGSMSQMDAMFRQTYQPYNRAAIPSFQNQYATWANTTLNTINGVVRAAGYQGQMLQKEAVWTQQVNAMNQTAMGRDELLQLSNKIATAEVEQLQSLRQLMIADMSTKAAIAAQTINTDAAQQSAIHNSFGFAVPVVSGKAW
jgi:P-type conjugative transfer protein TrbJ